VIEVDLKGNIDNCKKGCNEMFLLWGGWIRSNRPFGNPSLSNNQITHALKPALITIPESHSDYLKSIGCKSRNMISKAHRNGYFAEIINFDNYIQDIFEINTSKKIRQGTAMTEWYVKKPSEKKIINEDYCSVHNIKHYGILKDRKLFAWTEIHFMNELAIVNSILGHGDHLQYGIMNELISYIVMDSIRDHKQVRFINYLHLSCSDGLRRFKISVGFEQKTCFFKNNI
jgi:hypothetical protein